jgi:hypothetical protein
MQITVFHASTIPPDPFIAHVQVDVADLLHSKDDDFTLDLEPEGKIRLRINFQPKWAGTTITTTNATIVSFAILHC